MGSVWVMPIKPCPGEILVRADSSDCRADGVSWDAAGALLLLLRVLGEEEGAVQGSGYSSISGANARVWKHLQACEHVFYLYKTRNLWF